MMSKIDASKIDEMFLDLLGASPAAGVSADALLRQVRELERRAGEQKARITRLKAKARTLIDRAYNRALADVELVGHAPSGSTAHLRRPVR